MCMKPAVHQKILIRPLGHIAIKSAGKSIHAQMKQSGIEAMILKADVHVLLWGPHKKYPYGFKSI